MLPRQRKRPNFRGGEPHEGDFKPSAKIRCCSVLRIADTVWRGLIEYDLSARLGRADASDGSLVLSHDRGRYERTEPI
jgi:hypothetical protein